MATMQLPLSSSRLLSVESGPLTPDSAGKRDSNAMIRAVCSHLEVIMSDTRSDLDAPNEKNLLSPDCKKEIIRQPPNLESFNIGSDHAVTDVDVDRRIPVRSQSEEILGIFVKNYVEGGRIKRVSALENKMEDADSPTMLTRCDSTYSSSPTSNAKVMERIWHIEGQAQAVATASCSTATKVIEHSSRIEKVERRLDEQMDQAVETENMMIRLEMEFDKMKATINRAEVLHHAADKIFANSIETLNRNIGELKAVSVQENALGLDEIRRDVAQLRELLGKLETSEPSAEASEAQSTPGYLHDIHNEIRQFEAKLKKFDTQLESQTETLDAILAEKRRQEEMWQSTNDIAVATDRRSHSLKNSVKSLKQDIERIKQKDDRERSDSELEQVNKRLQQLDDSIESLSVRNSVESLNLPRDPNDEVIKVMQAKIDFLMQHSGVKIPAGLAVFSVDQISQVTTSVGQASGEDTSSMQDRMGDATTASSSLPHSSVREASPTRSSPSNAFETRMQALEDRHERLRQALRGTDVTRAVH